MGSQIELVLNPEINTGAIVKEKDGVGPSPPFKKTHDDQGEKYGAWLASMVRTLVDSFHSSAVGCSLARGFPCSSKDVSKVDLKVHST